MTAVLLPGFASRAPPPFGPSIINDGSLIEVLSATAIGVEFASARVSVQKGEDATLVVTRGPATYAVKVDTVIRVLGDYQIRSGKHQILLDVDGSHFGVKIGGEWIESVQI